MQTDCATVNVFKQDARMARSDKGATVRHAAVYHTMRRAHQLHTLSDNPVPAPYVLWVRQLRTLLSATDILSSFSSKVLSTSCRTSTIHIGAYLHRDLETSSLPTI